MIKRVVAVILAAAAMAWAGPASASAHADDTYVSPARVSVTPAVIEPGGRSTIEFSPGFFESGERVATDVSGAHSADAHVLGDGGAAVLVSRADGGMTAVFLAPRNGAGRYEVAFSASRDYVAVITVTADHADDAGADADADATTIPPTAEHGSAAPPDREGRVRIPRAPSETPEWPGLDQLPWSIALLAAVALVATTVTATLLIAARRRA